MKKCTNIQCKENNPQPFINFSIDKNSKDGYCYKCKKCVKEIKSKYDKERRKDPSFLLKEKERFLIKYYDLTLNDYNRLLHVQNFSCAICNIGQKDAGAKGLVVDHCHITNKVRGLLCGNCNTGLGKFRDRKDLLINAITYIARGKIK
jgi:hypothetical protein